VQKDRTVTDIFASKEPHMNMKSVSKILSVGVLLFASAPLASATPIDVTVDVGGQVSFDTTSVQFCSAIATGQTLNGLPIAFGTTVNFVSGPLVYNPGGAISPAFAIATMGPLTYYVTSETFTYSVDTANGFNDLKLMGTGYFSEAGYDNTPANFDLTAQEVIGTTAGTLQGSFSASSTALAAAPEPSSLVLLGTGFLTTAGTILRRRRTL
jgi:hypothetical protein